MALSVTKLKARIGRQLKFLGITSSGDENDDIIRDAVSMFCDMMDTPVISASLSVVTTTDIYTIPATIQKIVDIRDADGDSVVYTEDSTLGKITLQDSATAAATYTVYGTPADIETNVSTIVAAIQTRYEPVLMAYIRAFAYMWANEDSAQDKFILAEAMAKRVRKSNNRRLDMDFITNKTIDVTGNEINDEDNAEGITPQIDDLFSAEDEY